MGMEREAASAMIEATNSEERSKRRSPRLARKAMLSKSTQGSPVYGGFSSASPAPTSYDPIAPLITPPKTPDMDTSPSSPRSRTGSPVINDQFRWTSSTFRKPTDVPPSADWKGIPRPPPPVAEDHGRIQSHGLRERITAYLRRLAWELLACTIAAYVILFFAADPRSRHVFHSVLPNSSIPLPVDTISTSNKSISIHEWYADVNHTQTDDQFSRNINEATVSPAIFRSLRLVSIGINDLGSRLPFTIMPIRFGIADALATCNTAINFTTKLIWNFENHIGDMMDKAMILAAWTDKEYNRIYHLRNQSDLTRDNWIVSNILIPYIGYKPYCARLQGRQTQLLLELVQEIERRIPAVLDEVVTTCESFVKLMYAFDNVQILVRRDEVYTKKLPRTYSSDRAYAWGLGPGRDTDLVKKQLKKLKRVHGIINDASKRTGMQKERLGDTVNHVLGLKNLLQEMKLSDGAQKVTCGGCTLNPPEVMQLEDILSAIKSVAEDSGRLLDY